MYSPWYNHFEVKPSSVKHTSVHVKVSVNPNYRTFTCWYVFMQAVVVLCVRVSDCLLWSSQDWKHHTVDSLHCVYLCSNSMCLRYPHRRGNASVKTTLCLSICHICCSRVKGEISKTDVDTTRVLHMFLTRLLLHRHCYYFRITLPAHRYLNSSVPSAHPGRAHCVSLPLCLRAVTPHGV